MRHVVLALLALVASSLLHLGCVAGAGERVALVLGNSAYKNGAILPESLIDAQAVAMKLKSLGFQVIEAEDQDLSSFNKSLKVFSDSLDHSEMALLYYSGHGVEVEHEDYLLPIDAKLDDRAALVFEAVDVGEILRMMTAHSASSVVVLDMSRTNPFGVTPSEKNGCLSSAFKSFSIPTTAGTGAMLAFATSPGEGARSGSDELSPFTEALVDHLADKSAEIGTVFKRVRKETLALTDGKQVPWESSNLDELSLNP